MGDNTQISRFQIEWLWAFLPAFLGLGIVIILAELDVIEINFSIHDVDTFIILSGLILTISTASVLIAREGIRQMRQSTEKQLQERYAEDRARFLRLLDHEIKNPLMGIKTALDNLSEIKDLEKRGQIRIAISVQIDRLSRIITDLRKIADLDKHQIEHLPVDTHMLVQDAFSIASEDEQAIQRRMSLDLPDNLPAISGDYDLLLLAIYNVLNNALKYSCEGDMVKLSAIANDNYITITIQDTGSGIAADDLPHVWDELFRAEAVNEIPGSGIGLALVRRIVERHCGQTTIESQLGKGTTVCIVLPIHVSG